MVNFAQMKGSRYKYFSVSVFLALFFLSKMAGLHALSHHSDTDHVTQCIVCELAVVNSLHPVLPSTSADASLVSVEMIVKNEINADFDGNIDQSISRDQLFSRPPPSILL